MAVDMWVQKALEAGFAKAAPVETKKLKLLPEVRNMCAVNRCGQYGANWNCPPACGTLEECEARLRQYERGIVVETVGQLEDSFDVEGMTAAAEQHKERFEALFLQIKEAYPDVLALGTGGCRKCETCTYPDAPCRFPETLHASMEGYGMMVSDVCAACGIPYINGVNTVTYVGCYLFE